MKIYLTTRQVIAMRNIAHALKAFYADPDPYAGKFIPQSWIGVLEDRTALICEQCHGEGRVGGMTPDGYDDHKCEACDGFGLNLEQH
ncbi:hypothetical protein ACLEJW_09150 [Pseudomonas sp. SMSB3]|uniref:hypothetical protein n=1 Tax=Pseudomonas sp. SMSB3 TaxID=3390196 RepID=UPI003F861C27